jgi:predicted nucleic acid-binding protein
MKPQRVERHTFTATDKLLLDASIWLFLYCPHGDPKACAPLAYSSAFKEMLSAKSKIFINSTVLAEFINRYCRLVHALMQDGHGAAEDFKKFRKSGAFKKVAKAVSDAVRRILRDTRKIDTGFSTIDAERILNDFESGRYDFNDLVIADLCTRNRLTLITHDSDFCSGSFPVLTANALLAN